MCAWCHVDIRPVDVLVGPAGDMRAVQMFIDSEPAEPRDGESVVICRTDGRFRLLMPEVGVAPNVATFRIHGSKTCGGESP